LGLDWLSFGTFPQWSTGDVEMGTRSRGTRGIREKPGVAAAREMADLEGNLALVTGAAGGIGRAVTVSLLAAGASVLAFDAEEDSLEEARAAWDAEDRVYTIVGDVGDADDVAAAFDRAKRTGQQLTALVTCAGIHSHVLAEDLSDDEWHRVLRVNLKGTFLCCREAARTMIPQGAGSIVTMSSSLAYTGSAGRAHYAASKAAISAFTKSLALELAPHGIRANVVVPGVIDTPMPRNVTGRTEEDVQRSLRRNPMRRVGSARDVADLILFLLSARSSHITGQVVHINGGDLMP